MALLKTAKAYIWGGIAAAFGILLIALRYVTSQNSRLRHKAERAEANLHRRQVVAEADLEIEKVEQDVRERIKKDSASAAFDPNSLWNNEDDS